MYYDCILSFSQCNSYEFQHRRLIKLLLIHWALCACVSVISRHGVFGSMVLLIFMYACIYMFTSFFKNLHERTLTITNMTCKCLIRPRCVALNTRWRLLGNIVISMTGTSRIFLSVCLVLWKNPYQFGLLINTNRLCIGHRNLHQFF